MKKGDSATADLPELSLSLYRVTLMARERLDLPAYLGSTLRGAFGHVFRSLACPGRFNEPCPIPDTCPYHLIFETSPPPGSEALRTHDEIPRPFVIAPITENGWLERGRNLIEPGSELSFDLTLIGRAQEFFPYFVVALREIDRLGRHRGTLPSVIPSEPSASEATRDQREAISPHPTPSHKTVELRRIELRDPFSATTWPVYDSADNLVRPMRKPLTLSDCAALPPPSSGRFTVDFLTQTRIKHEGGFARVPEFQIVFRRLLGRLSSLSRFHCGTPLDVDFKGLIDQASQVRLIDNQTRWVSWTRYSSRQRQRMQWEGMIGRTIYGSASPSVIPTGGASLRAAVEGSTRSDLSEMEGRCSAVAMKESPGPPELAAFWKFLKFGEFVHVGHGTTFGLGKYALRAD